MPSLLDTSSPEAHDPLIQAVAELSRADTHIPRSLFARSNIVNQLTANPEDFALFTVQEALWRLEVVEHDEEGQGRTQLNAYVHEELRYFFNPSVDKVESSVPANFFAVTALGKAMAVINEMVQDKFGPMYDPQLDVANDFGRFVLGSALHEVQSQI